METTTNKAALLIMDMQTAFLSRITNTEAVKANVAKAISHARSINMPIIFVVAGFRQGAPELALTNKVNVARKTQMQHVNMEEMMKIDPSVAPLIDELLVVKRRVSAFAGSDLEILLRGLGVQHLILTGIATSGVVLSTIREAADKDYELTVISDCCADADEETHRLLTAKVFTRQGDVLTVDEWVK